jgi:hypothetical protein
MAGSWVELCKGNWTEDNWCNPVQLIVKLWDILADSNDMSTEAEEFPFITRKWLVKADWEGLVCSDFSVEMRNSIVSTYSSEWYVQALSNSIHKSKPIYGHPYTWQYINTLQMDVGNICHYVSSMADGWRRFPSLVHLSFPDTLHCSRMSKR